MKQTLLAAIALLLYVNSFSQDFKPSFGKIEVTDLEMKECAFDKNAEALVLFDVGRVYCNLNAQSVTGDYLRSEFSRHVRIKILTDDGFNEADIKIPYYSGGQLEDIKNIVAHTINLDASGKPVYTKVEKSLIYHKKINKRYSEVIFTFPEVKKGSVIEYKYTTFAQNLYAVKPWLFQNSIPVKYSRYTLDFPAEIVITATSKGGFDVKRDENLEGNRVIKSFSLNDVPALRDEPYITCDEDYLQQVVPIMEAFDMPGRPRQNLISNWPTIIKELMEDEDFGIQLKRNIPRTRDLDSLLKKVSDPYQKMVIIHNYVRNNMQWNESYGIWALDGVRSAWKDRKGTSGEINLILVNLLKDADLKVHPVLVSTRDNGRVNPGIPSISQFDKVMAYVTINGNVYVLDATDKFTPPNLIPYEVLNSEGLVIEKISTYEWGWKMLTNDTKSFKNTVLLLADIDDKGQMNGNATVNSSEYSRLERAPILKKGLKAYTEKYYSYPGLAVDSVDIENTEMDSLPLNQRFKFTNKISTSGDYNYFSVNLFSGLEKNPFLADNRFSDVFFGSGQRYTIVGQFSIPEGFRFDELPKNVRMIIPDTSIVFSRIMQATDNKLSVRIQLEIKRPFYSADEYPDFQQFYKKLFELLNEQVVFKKI